VIIDEITRKYGFASERNLSMYKNIAIYALLLLFFVPQTSSSQEKPHETLAILKEADVILAALSDNIDRLENIQSDLEKMSIANGNYNEQKNIWLSSVLSISTIKSICEFEHALFTLFMELGEKNRRRYYNVRHRSLVTSTQQINIMYEQIKINHTMISHDPSEKYIIEKERYAIQTTLDLFKLSIDLIISLKEQSGR
jgi:chlorite dismutase